MSKEKRRVPKLRFPGFTEDWEQYRLDELLIERSILCTQSEKYPLVSFTVERGVTPKTERYNREALVVGNKASKKYKLTLMDDIVYNPANLKFGAIARNKYGKAVFSPIYVTLEVKSDRIISDFLEYILTSKSFINKALRYQQGTVYERQSVNVESFLLQTINIPTVNEQIAISNLLYKYDKIISIYKHKLVVLNLKKKALLQKLFPKQGATCPTLRFPGYTDDWEQRKLGDFTNQINTFVNPEDAKLPLWSLTAEAGLIEKSDRYERDFLVKKKDQFKRIETNTLVYNPMNITIGSIDIYTGLYPIAVSGYYVSIVYDKNIDTDFLKEALLLPSSLKMYKNYATGSLIERQRVQYPTFSKLQLLFPNLDEQKAIGQLFKSLNLNITLHQRKLEHLQLQKKSLLQQMFV